MKMENVLPSRENPCDNNQGMDFAYNWETAEELRVWVQQMAHYLLLETGLDAKKLLEMYERQAYCDGLCRKPVS